MDALNRLPGLVLKFPADTPSSLAYLLYKVYYDTNIESSMRPDYLNAINEVYIAWNILSIANAYWTHIDVLVYKYPACYPKWTQ